MTGVVESIILAGIFAVVFGAGSARSEKSSKRGMFLSGLIAELSRNSAEKNSVHRVDSAMGRSTCQ
jgi:Tfp pilus assembly protein PilN